MPHPAKTAYTDTPEVASEVLFLVRHDQMLSGLVFGYGAVDLTEIERGLAELQGVLTQSGRSGAWTDHARPSRTETRVPCAVRWCGDEYAGEDFGTWPARHDNWPS